MSSVEMLLNELDRVRQVASGRWVAKCPAHEDSSPSLSIRELDDGRILLYDFGGCSTTSVLSAIGLTVGDLFPQPLAHHTARGKPNHWHAMREAMKALHHECLVCAIAANDVAEGRPVTREDAARVVQCAKRIRMAIEACL